MENRTFYFYDKVSGEEFFVEAVTLEKARNIAMENFDEPVLIDEVDLAVAEMMGLDTY